MLTAILCLFRISREYVKCISRTRPRKYILPRRKKRKTKKKAQRKTDESLAETLIGAGFPRYEEIVKRFMKAFMKGFTRHGPNWGPGFASATHVLPRRRGAPSCPPETPRGPTCARPSSSSSFPLRARLRERAAFSLSILESASFFIIIIISVVDTSLDRVVLVFFSLSSFFFVRSYPPRTYFIGRYFP